MSEIVRRNMDIKYDYDVFISYHMLVGKDYWCQVVLIALPQFERHAMIQIDDGVRNPIDDLCDIAGINKEEIIQIIPDIKEINYQVINNTINLLGIYKVFNQFNILGLKHIRSSHSTHVTHIMMNGKPDVSKFRICDSQLLNYIYKPFESNTSKYIDISPSPNSIKSGVKIFKSGDGLLMYPYYFRELDELHRVFPYYMWKERLIDTDGTLRVYYHPVLDAIAFRMKVLDMLIPSGVIGVIISLIQNGD